MPRPVIALSLACFSGLSATFADVTPAGEYLGRLRATVDAIRADLPHITAVAAVAADRLVAGGSAWLAGPHRGFIMEGLGRAGGMMHLGWLQNPDDLKPGDVVLVGTVTTPAAVDIIPQAEQGGAEVVLLAPTNIAGPHQFICVQAPPADDPAVLPTASPALAVAFWTFTGELVGALTRRGKMPPMYQSVLVPGGRERNEEHLGRIWEPATVQPQAEGALGTAFLDALAACIERLAATQLEGFSEAGRLMGDTLAAGKTVWYAALGHMPPEQPGQIGDPGLLKPLPVGPAPEGLAEHVQPGDLICYVGYYEPWGPWVEAAHAAGARIVTIVSGTPERAAEDMGADLNLNGCWPFGDSLVEVPGYDVKILPASGIIQSAAFWMLSAEAAAQHSRLLGAPNQP